MSGELFYACCFIDPICRILMQHGCNRINIQKKVGEKERVQGLEQEKEYGQRNRWGIICVGGVLVLPV